MVADQKHSSDSIASEQEVIRHTEKTAQLFGLDEQNAGAYKAFSGQIWALDEKMGNYYSEYKKSVKRLERDVGSLKIELDDLDECVDRETVVDLIHEIVPSLIGKKGKGFSYSSESSEESDSVETVRERKAVSHK